MLFSFVLFLSLFLRVGERGGGGVVFVVVVVVVGFGLAVGFFELLFLKCC